jgi:hypothetical protein
MPKVLNKFGVVTIVSEKRALEMVTFDGAQLLDEPDMLPGDPIDSRSARQPNARRLSPPTKAEQQEIAAQKETIRDLDIASKEDRLRTRVGVEIDSDSATPEEAMEVALAQVKKVGRPAKK